MTTIVFRRGVSDEWDSADPVLADGEPGFASDTGVFKIGDGVTAWSGLTPIPNADVIGRTYVPQVVFQQTEFQPEPIFRVKPKSGGSGDFRAFTHSIPNVDGSVNHVTYFGWNVGRTHNTEVDGTPALAMGFESNFYDAEGDKNHGPEWYIEQAAPDGSHALFRPFYARGSIEPSHNQWAIHFDIGTDGRGHFDVFGGKLKPVLFTVNKQQAVFQVPLSVSESLHVSGPIYAQGSLVVERPNGQALLLLNTNVGGGPVLQFGIKGTSRWSLYAEGASAFKLLDQSNRAQVTYVRGGTSATASTHFASAVHVEGSFAAAGEAGFFGTVPIAKPKGVAVDVQAIHAALMSLGLIAP